MLSPIGFAHVGAVALPRWTGAAVSPVRTSNSRQRAMLVGAVLARENRAFMRRKGISTKR